MPARNSQSMTEVLYQPGQVGIARVSQVMVEALISLIGAPSMLPLNATALKVCRLPENFREDEKDR